jgi:hypothetical protein
VLAQVAFELGCGDRLKRVSLEIALEVRVEGLSPEGRLEQTQERRAFLIRDVCQRVVRIAAREVDVEDRVLARSAP